MRHKNSNETVLNLKGKLFGKNTNLLSNIDSYSCTLEIDLSGNELETLPSDLLKFKSLQILNLANNPFKDYKEIASMLQSFLNLHELHIDLEKESDAEILLSSLPQLRLLNGKRIQEEETETDFDLDDDGLETLSFNSEIKRFNSIIQRTSSFQGFSSFKTDFEFKLKEQVEFINSNMNIPNYLYAINILKSKIDIYNYIQSKLASMIPYLNKKNEMIEISNISLEIIDYVSEHHNEMVEIIFRLHPRIQNQINCLKSNYEGVNSKQTGRKGKIISNRQQENNNIKLKSGINVSDDNITSNPSNNNQQSQRLMKSSLRNKNAMKEGCAKKVKEIKNRIGQNAQSNYKLNKSSSAAVLTTVMRPIKSSSFLFSHQISIKQLLSIINEIYQSKSNHDLKCKENRLQKETLEQHMYIFLNKKYGLKTITLEMASSIISGIRQFSQSNSEICLFGKILRNELEEESHQVFLKLKQTLIQLLSYYYQIKYPYKSHGVIGKVIQEKQNSFLTQDEWSNMLKYLFPSDHDIIEDKIMEYITKKNESNQNYINQNYPKVNYDIKQLSREEIKAYNAKKVEYKLYYYDFAMILLDFQIRLRDKYLLNFIKAFKSVNSNDDGVVNENQFRDLILKLDIASNENFDLVFEHLLSLVDPFNTKKITFSDCVSVLSNEKFDDEMSMMDKIALNNIDNTASIMNNE